jgi:hypothetical protein
MPYITTGSTSIPFGTNLRIGYRTYGTADPFTYLTHLPSYTELPYTATIPLSGAVELEYSVACPNCTGASQFSDAQTLVVTL